MAIPSTATKSGIVSPLRVTALPRAARREPPLALITLTVMLGLIMAIIDSSIVNVALDTMAGNLGSSIDEISWVSTGYILANVVVMPLNGWLTAYFGRKRFYAGCLAIFTFTSFLCATATNIWVLVFYRVLQGLGGGALQPTAQSILFESYPPERRSSAMAIFGLGAMVGPAIGPTLGGWLIDNYSWPLIFLINIPIGIVALVMTFAYIRDPGYIVKPTKGLDWAGLGMMTAGIAALQYVLERGQRDDWFGSTTICIMSAVAIFGIGSFIVRELLDPEPLVDLRVFRSRAFTAGNIIGIISGFGLFGLNLVLPLFFEEVLGFTATQTGVALLPGAIATALSMPVAGRAAKFVDGRISIGLGLALFGLASWMMGDLNGSAGFWDIFWPRAWQGFALGFIFVPLTTATLATVPRARMASATGIYTLLRQLGGGIGIAALQLIQQRSMDAAYAGLASTATLSNTAVAQMLQRSRDPHASLQSLQGMIVREATVISYDNLFRICGVLFLISVPTVFLLAGRPRNVDPAAAVAAVD